MVAHVVLQVVLVLRYERALGAKQTQTIHQLINSFKLIQSVEIH